MRKKSMLALTLSLVMTASLFTGCSSTETTATTEATEATGNTSEESEGTGEEITLVIATYDVPMAIYEALDLEGRFNEVYPEITLEFESYKDVTEYGNAMKIRASADALPDVMALKSTDLETYADYMVDLSGSEIAENNIYADDYSVDGKIVAVPTVTTHPYIYYWKDMYEAAGCEVPDTWSEFVEVTEKLRDYYAVEDPDVVPLAVGAKDTWTTYPYIQNMPVLQDEGHGSIFAEMASMDEPFAEGTSLYAAYSKVYELFTAGVCGSDPLGVGNDQYETMFGARQVVMTSGATNLYNKLIAADTDISQLGTYIIPVRDSEDDVYNSQVEGDHFLAISNSTEYLDACEKYLEFFFSDAFYSEYVAMGLNGSTLEGVDVELPDVLQEAADILAENDSQEILFMGTNADFLAIQSETQFDYYLLGTQFFVDGFDFDAEMERLNTEWAEAREELGIE